MKQIYSILILFLTFCANLSAQNYQIGHISTTYTDSSRNNYPIPVEIYYPANTSGDNVPVANAAFPIVSFGHGFVMVWSAYENVWTNLVPQGYIVAFTKTQGSFSPSHGDYGKDLAFIINKLKQENQRTSSPFYQKINNKSAIMGHSMGGGASFLASKNNLNISTMVTFAAANTNPSAISAARFVAIPTLVFAAEKDCVAPPATQQNILYDSLTATACKTLINIKGGGHCYFANANALCSIGEQSCINTLTINRQQQQNTVNNFLKLWLDIYLKNNSAAQTIWLDSLANSNQITHRSSCLAIGMEQYEQNNRLLPVHTYPNPFTNQLNLDFRDLKSQIIQVQLIGNQGQTVYKSIQNTRFEQLLTIDVSGFQQGLYLLKIDGLESNLHVIKKMVKR